MRLARHPFLRRAMSLASIALLAMSLPTAVLATNNSGAIDTEFSVTVEGCDATLTAVAGEDERETGSFAIYLGPDVVVEGEYDIAVGETLTFGPYPLATGSYLLVWDSEPGHDPSQSHSELAFEVACDPEPTPTPEPTDPAPTDPAPTPTPDDGGVAPTTGVNPTKRPSVTLPPTDTLAEAGATSTTPATLPIVLGLGLLSGIAVLLTPSPARIRSRRGTDRS
jgi:hypothetical protein